MKTKKCIIEGCTEPAEDTRKYCRAHYLQRKREQAKAKREANMYHRTMYENVCSWCGKTFIGYRKDMLVCSKECNRAMRVSINSLSTYKLSSSRGSMSYMHRYLAAQAVGEEVLKNKELHHKDFDPENNSLSNLLVLSKADHTKLHKFILFNAVKRTSYTDPNRRKKMYALIPELTDEFFAVNGIKAVTVQSIADHLRS